MCVRTIIKNNLICIDCRSDFTMDPEEARAKAASRKASRMASRERGEEEVVPVEDLGGNLF